MNKKNLCVKPWIHIVQHTNGYYSPCCKIEDLLMHDGSPAKNLEDAWNSETLKNLREDFLNGKKPSLCQQCWVEES